MKIAQVCHVYLPHIGGIEYYIKRLVTNLEEEGFDVKVLTTDYHTPLHVRQKEASYFKTTFRFMRNPFSWALAKHLKAKPYDIIHVHNVWFLPCLTAVFFRKNARIITTMHGVYPDTVDLKLKLFLRLYKPFAKYILNRSAKIIVLSLLEKAKLESIFKVPADKIEIIHNGIYIQSCHDEQRKRVILFTGRIIPHKNPDVLIRSTVRLSAELRNFKIVFVGPVEEKYKYKLIRLAKKCHLPNEIEFLGELDQSDLEEKHALMGMYQQASIFVSLGSWEGMPTRIMEAMQFKTPVISYMPGGNSELIVDNQNGLIIERLDADLLAQKLDHVLMNPGIAASLGDQARTTIERDFDWNKIFRKILKLYQS